MPAERLRISTRSAFMVVGLFGLTLAVLGLISASERVLGWMLAAGALAGLLHPTVVLLSRRMPRGLALGLVMFATIASTGIVVYGVADSLVRETRHLQRVVPERAAELERSGRFAELAREVQLAERAGRVVDSIPERLQGGSAADALRAAATRGVAFLATFVLTLFLLSHGRVIAGSALAQIHDDQRRRRVHDVVLAAYRRGFGYARGTIAMAVIAGLTAYALGLAANVPGPAPLAVGVAILDVIPFLGAFLGAIPIIVLGGAASTANAVLLTMAFVAFQAFEALVLQRRVERATLRLGPFLTIGAVFGGLELYGIGGALILLLSLAVSAAALSELMEPDDDADDGEAAPEASPAATKKAAAATKKAATKKAATKKRASGAAT